MYETIFNTGLFNDKEQWGDPNVQPFVWSFNDK
jgi:hypothetical protein